MNQNLNVFQLASSLAAHANQRQALIAQNIANADTPGFKARDLAPFTQSFADGGMTMRATRPGHLAARASPPMAQIVTDSAFGAEAPNGNSVSIEDQMVRAADVRQQHDLAMGIYQKSLQILRISMGRK